MTDFILKQNQSAQILEFLRSTVSGFKESPEYLKLREYEHDISAVVMSAFAEYVCRIHDQNCLDIRKRPPRAAITSAHEAVQVMASWSESSSRELLTDELFENLDCKKQVLDDIKQHLKPHALALYE